MPRKKSVAPIKEGGAIIPTSIMKMIDNLRAPVRSYVTLYVKGETTREDLAATFMGAYHKYEDAGVAGSSFVAFCRLIDPTIPLPTKEYKKHRTYAALDYLRRKHTAAGTGKRDPRANWMEVTARVLASVFGVVADKDRLWMHVENEFVPVIGAGRMTKLRAMVEQTEGLVVLKAKPITNANVELTHVEHTEHQQSAAA